MVLLSILHHIIFTLHYIKNIILCSIISQIFNFGYAFHYLMSFKDCLIILSCISFNNAKFGFCNVYTVSVNVICMCIKFPSHTSFLERGMSCLVIGTLGMGR